MKSEDGIFNGIDGLVINSAEFIAHPSNQDERYFSAETLFSLYVADIW